MLLGQLGLSAEHNGQLLLPIGTVYDPFVCRGLDALIHGVYSAAKFVFAGTPSGVTLSPEGGAHQSTITPSIGLELPNLTTFEPAFAREVEWCLLDGLRRCCDRENGDATYLRLSTQADRPVAVRAGARAPRRGRAAPAGAGGWLPPDRAARRDLTDAPRVVIATGGRAGARRRIAATQALHEEGIAATLLNVTSADRLYRRAGRARGAPTCAARRSAARAGHLATLLPPAERRAPIVTVLDGASHALAFLGSVFGAPVVPLGVDQFRPGRHARRTLPRVADRRREYRQRGAAGARDRRGGRTSPHPAAAAAPLSHDPPAAGDHRGDGEASCAQPRCVLHGELNR